MADAIATRAGENVLATIHEGVKLARRSVRQAEVLRYVHEVRVTDGPIYRSKSRWWWLSNRFFVDADSGEPAIKEISWLHNHKAEGTVQVLSQPTATEVRPQIWQFPVEQTEPENAVITAVDDAGKTRMRFRRTPALKQGIRHARVVGDDAGIDIVLSPGLKPSPELLLIAGVAAQWMITYFISISGPAV
jgi:hypothetical protein